jgi:TonB family protein
MRIRLLFAALVLLILLSASLARPTWPNNRFLQSLVAQLDAWRQARPEDKVYLQTDRPFYRPGETIWFSAQVREGSTLQASQQSQVLRVELLGPKGNVLKAYQLIAQQGVAQGDYSLGDEAPGGLYTLRAYTQWQQNDPNPAIFETQLTVQRVVLPRLKMKLDFQRKAYGPGAEVLADLSLQQNNQQPLAGHAFRYVVTRDGHPWLDGQGQTDPQGNALLRFALSPTLTSADLLLNVMIGYQGQTESISRAVPVVLNQLSLAFFPEGGDLVRSLPGRVAFRATDAHGKPADIAGVVLDRDGQEVTRFESFHQGMGAFALTPASRQRYQVRITEPQGVDSLYDLPSALNQGYGLHVQQIDRESVTLALRSSHPQTLSLIATVRGNSYFTAEVPVTKGQQLVEVPLAPFPIGVAQFTLFDSQGIERCERLAFVNRHRQLQIEVETNQAKYLPREAVEVTLTTRDEAGRPVPADLALSVVDDQLLSFADDKSSHLLSWLLVESEIQGKVEEPRFYVDPEEEKAEEALDYLLMTAGWRRFSWAQRREDAADPVAFAAEPAVIHGKVWGPNGQPLPKARVRVGDAPVEIRSDAQGEFHLHDVDLSEPTAIWVQSPDMQWEQRFWPQRYGDTLACHLGMIQGRILDEQGEPLLGATVCLLDRHRKVRYGAYTDDHGDFSFRRGPEVGREGTLSISYIGYQTDTMAIANWINHTTHTLTLRPGGHFDEVVVMGYSSQKRSSITSSISSQPAREKKTARVDQPSPPAPPEPEFIEGEADAESDLPAPVAPIPADEAERMRIADPDLSPKQQEELRRLQQSIARVSAKQQRIEAAPDISEVLSADEAPTPINLDQIQAQIGYPAAAVQANIQGTVMVRMQVDAKGTYLSHRIQAGHPLLQQAVEAHVRQLAFSPWIEAGRPKSFFVNVPFRFNLPADRPQAGPIHRLPTQDRRILTTGQPGPINLGKVWAHIDYPKIARDAGIQGEVRFRVLINAQGQYVRHELLAQAHPILTQAVEPFLDELSYHAETSQDSLTWIEVPFRFELTDPSELRLQSYQLGFQSAPQQMPYHRVRQFPVPAYAGPVQPGELRDDFRSTIYWNGHVQTGQDGHATLRFPTSDALTSFRLTVEGLSRSGLPGRAETVIFTQKPLALQARLPVQLVAQDTLRLPLTVLNHSAQPMTAELSYRIPEALQALAKLPTRLRLQAGETKTLYLPLLAVGPQGDGRLELRVSGGGFDDAVAQTLRIVPRGYPREQAFSGQSLTASHQPDIRHLVPGSLRGSLTVFPSVAGEIMEGLAGMLREPHGCFEQTSSTTYPNLLVLNYLESTGQADPALRERALGLIERGYQRLTSFECQNGGYEWFGKGPGHEGLTAYGLMEFVDMAKVWGGVDPAMVKRTADWLLSRRNGQGGFKRNPRALHQFGLTDSATMSTYVTWALTEAGYLNLSQEIDFAYRTALESRQPYCLGLAANALLNVGRREEARELLRLLQQDQQDDGQWVHAAAWRSAPGSSGQALSVETAALALSAMLKDPQSDRATMLRSVGYLRSQRNARGSFGSTNSTVLALRALVAFAQASQELEEDGRVEVWVNGQAVAGVDYQAGRREPIVMEGLAAFLGDGKQPVTVRFVGTKVPLPYTLGLTWHTSLPESDATCAVGLAVDLTQTELAMGETVRLTAHVRNRREEGQPMTIARLALPAGLGWQPWQLKQLQEKGQVAFYEVIDQELVLYWRQMAPGEEKEIRLDVKAELPGRYAAAASQAYLYYTDELRSWVALPAVDIHRSE